MPWARRMEKSSKVLMMSWKPFVRELMLRSSSASRSLEQTSLRRPLLSWGGRGGHRRPPKRVSHWNGDWNWQSNLWGTTTSQEPMILWLPLTVASKGQILAVSLAQGGPTPAFFSPWTYSYLSSGKINLKFSTVMQWQMTWLSCHLNSHCQI